MSEMVSKVAEALAQSFRDTVARVSGDSWEATGVTLPSKDVFERYARAAIEVMLEPTPNMIEAAGSALVVNDDGNDPREVWQLMIDAALSPSTVVPGERK